jgi:hypothetical protein
METSSLAVLKKEVQTLSHPALVDLLIRLGKYKKENKELLHYLLFEAHDEQAYIDVIKAEVEPFISAKKQSAKFFGVSINKSNIQANPKPPLSY